jgi:hypothetical protein
VFVLLGLQLVRAALRYSIYEREKVQGRHHILYFASGLCNDAGWSGLVARRVHNPEGADPNSASAAINSRVVQVLQAPIHANSER